MLKVLGNRILIKPDEIEDPTARYEELRKAGLKVVRLDEKAERAAQDQGTVTQIGHAAWFDFPQEYKGWCSVGDKVIYARHSGKFIIDPETEEKFIIINDNDVQCIVKTSKKGKK